MLYALICRDHPGALQTRLDTRPAHLAYIEATGMVEMAGPLLEDGQMAGSLIILRAESLTDARAWTEHDPYAQAGLFADVTVMEWKKVIG